VATTLSRKTTLNTVVEMLEGPRLADGDHATDGSTDGGAWKRPLTGSAVLKHTVLDHDLITSASWNQARVCLPSRQIGDALAKTPA
jgi:hypothetical protein